MNRESAIQRAAAYFDTGRYIEDLTRRVALPTESQDPGRGDVLRRYLTEEMQGSLERLGCECRIMENPADGGGPLLFAQRFESTATTTVLSYGHGDVVRGYDNQWREGLSPWRVTRAGDRIYGRGTADNKGQHTINLAALEAVLEERGRLGFNFKLLLEMGEEIGSPGLREICRKHKDLLRADVLIASDGPRLRPDRPTIYLGTRGALNFDLIVDLRDGAHHSGNWGGLLANPGVILAHAIAAIISPTGVVQATACLPQGIPDSVRDALHAVEVDGGENSPTIDTWWGQPGLSSAEKVFAWNTFEVLAFKTGNPEHPVNAIPPRAKATCQFRFTVDVDPETLLPSLRKHLDAGGLSAIEIRRSEKGFFPATRLDPDHPWVQWTANSIRRTTGREPVVLPSIGGSLPNDVFACELGLPTVWIPHSYVGCSQHAPDEHVLIPVQREALELMAGVFWDLGEIRA